MRAQRGEPRVNQPAVRRISRKSFSEPDELRKLGHGNWSFVEVAGVAKVMKMGPAGLAD